MINTAKIEGYLINIGVSFDSLDEVTWIINDDDRGLRNFLVIAEEPLVILRVKVMEQPAERKEEFFRQLLSLNASDLIHGAYAMDRDDVILIDTLEYDSMDQEEFQASLEAMGLALAQHYHLLAEYRDTKKQ
jgi:hypothetical protein